MFCARYKFEGVVLVVVYHSRFYQLSFPLQPPPPDIIPRPGLTQLPKELYRLSKPMISYWKLAFYFDSWFFVRSSYVWDLILNSSPLCLMNFTHFPPTFNNYILRTKIYISDSDLVGRILSIYYYLS